MAVELGKQIKHIMRLLVIETAGEVSETGAGQRRDETREKARSRTGE